jgi:hypothetical protein
MEFLFYIFNFLPGGMIGILLPVAGIALFFFLRQRKGQEGEIPPLDLIDGKKLDAMVSSRVDRALKPLLTSEGYSEEQIQAILTRSSLGGTRFKR